LGKGHSAGSRLRVVRQRLELAEVRVGTFLPAR